MIVKILKKKPIKEKRVKNSSGGGGATMTVLTPINQKAEASSSTLQVRFPSGKNCLLIWAAGRHKVSRADLIRFNPVRVEKANY